MPLDFKKVSFSDADKDGDVEIEIECYDGSYHNVYLDQGQIKLLIEFLKLQLR